VLVSIDNMHHLEYFFPVVRGESTIHINLIEVETVKFRLTLLDYFTTAMIVGYVLGKVV